MADLEILKSYLVSLGFSVDRPALRKFDLVLRDTAGAIETHTSGMVKAAAKAQTAITSAFTAISAATIGMVDQVAMADQGYRLFGLRMFLTEQQARKLKVGMDSLNASLAEISWDPELRKRFLELSDLQDRLVANLGPDFERNMRAIRDLRFEFTKLRVEVQYMVMQFASSLFKSFGTDIDGVLAKLRDWEQWIQDRGPEIADWFAKNLTPVLKDTWEMLKLTGAELGDFALLFTNFVGLLSGDNSIQGTEFSFEKLAGAIEHVVGWLDAVVRSITNAERLLVHFADAAVLALSGKFADAKKELQSGLSELSPGTGAVLGGVAGPIVGGLLGLPMGPLGVIAGASAGAGIGAGIGALKQGISPSDPNQTAIFSPSDIASQAREAALKAGQKLGIDPRLIFEQFQHETGNFTSRVAKEDNNLAGIRNGLGYRRFDSIDAFADYYANLLSSKRYTSQGILQAKSEEDFAGALKRGGYYEDSYSNYVAGMKRFQRMDAAASSQVSQNVTVGDIQVNVTNSNASPDEIGQAVQKHVSAAFDRQTQRTLPQLAYVG